MRRNKKKPKLKLGDFINDNKYAIGQAGNTLGSMVNAGSEPTSEAGGIASGALSGASTGAAFGPWGAAAGAVIGGVSGLIGSKNAQEAQVGMNLQKNRAEDQFLLNNGQSLKHGGKLLAKRLQVEDGGQLNAVSDDAVEVRANDPNATDSVELKDAYVDNNEIIDRENRVFSDAINLPNGRTIAKEAKRLEKQKSESYNTRFASANKRIDDKLDNLFNYQESTKQEEMSKGLRDGGNIGRSAGKASSLSVSGKAAAGSDWDQFKTNLQNNFNGKGNVSLNPNASLSKAKNFEGGRLSQSTLLEQAMTAREIKRLITTKYEKADWNRGGKMAPPALYYTPPANMPRMVSGGRINTANYNARLAEGPGPDSRINLGNYKDRVFDHFKLNPSTKYLQNPKRVASGIETPTPSIRDERVTRRGRLNFKKGGKIGYDGGGQKATWDEDSQGMVYDQFSGANATNPNVTGSGLPKLNLQQGMATAATFAPNLVNSFLQKRLQGPASPQMEQATRLDRVDPSYQYAQADNDFNKINTLMTRNTAQAGNLTSALGSNLSRKLQANNQIAGQTQHINAGIQGNEAFINMQKQARNADRSTGFRNAQVEFGNKKLQMTSQNVSNLSEKVLMRGREKNNMDLDKDKFNILMGQYGNLPEAMKARYPTPFDYYNENKTGKKKGGHLLDMFKKHKNANRGNGVIADDPDNLKMGGKLKRNTKKK